MEGLSLYYGPTGATGPETYVSITTRFDPTHTLGLSDTRITPDGSGSKDPRVRTPLPRRSPRVPPVPGSVGSRVGSDGGVAR